MNNQNKKPEFWKFNRKASALLLFLALGLSIRFYQLGAHNFWFDEYVTHYYVQNFSSFQRIREVTFRYLFSHQVYYILLKFWRPVFGKSEFSFRFLPMVFGVVSIPVIYKLGKLFFNSQVGLISAFLLAISPMHIWYSQEARGYSLATFLIMLVVYFFASALKKNKRHLWAGFIISSIIAFYTNYSCLYLIIVLSGILFTKKYRHMLKQYLLSYFLIGIFFMLQAPNIIEQFSRISSNFWIPRPNLNAILITFENFNVGYNATPVIYSVTFMICSFLYIFGIWRWWKERKKELSFLILSIFIPIIITFVISQRTSIYLDRQLLLFSPFYYLIIAAGLERINMRSIRMVMYISISLPILFCLHNYFSYRMPMPNPHHIGAYVKKPVKPAADYIQSDLKEGDAVGFAGPSSLSVLYYIDKKALKYKNIPLFSFLIKSKIDTYWLQNWKKDIYGGYFGLRRDFVTVIELDNGKPWNDSKEYIFKRLWLITSAWERDGTLTLHEQAVRKWAQTNYSFVESKEFNGIFIDLYCQKSNPL